MGEIPLLKLGELIHEGVSTRVFRARHGPNGEAVVVKTPKPGEPEPAACSELTREYELIKDIHSPFIIEARGLRELDGGPALLLEDFGGESLRQVLESRTLGLLQMLEIALQLTAALDALREHRLVHKDLNPANILVRLDPLMVKLTDFGLAQRLGYDGREVIRPERIGGTLAYISPEQTGRVNRIVDYRSDYYSLGVTLYRMFTGRLPFPATDPLELVAAHIARQPQPPTSVSPAVPPPLSAIILKLMEKDPEQRYRSPASLEADLRRCLEEVKAQGVIMPFEPGQADHPIYFQIPQKLYGREPQVQTLLEAFSQMADSGTPRLVLVGGEPGVGKSSLIREAQKPTAERRGFLVTGKFDPFTRHIPFAALVPAFNALLVQLLAASEELMARWSGRLKEAVGTSGQVLVALMPALEALIGPQPPVPELGAVEAQNRLHWVFVRFIHAFTSSQSPLVLFLDDLQWADSASMDLLHTVVTDGETRHLLVVGTYRDRDVDDGHRLMAMIRALRERGVPTDTLLLQPVSARDVEHLVADALGSSREATHELAEIIFLKTHGNPFFIDAFLRSLHKEGNIFYEPRTGWRWDAARVRGALVTDNVLEVMEGELARLSSVTRALLQRAACLGGAFDLSTLALAAGLSRDETVTVLEPALAHGFVFLQDGVGRFAHDRVREAAYAGLDAEQALKLHHDIGMTLLEHCDHTGAAELHERLFDVVGQLMKGARWLSTTTRPRLSRLCLEAGHRAKSSAAYEAALQYADAGIACLPEDAWNSDRALAQELHLHQLECMYLNKRYSDFEALFPRLYGRLEQLSERAALYQLRIVACISQGRLPEAVEVGAAGLRSLFALELPRTDADVHLGLQAELGKALGRLQGQSIPALVDMPEMKDPDRQALTLLAAEVLPAAFISKPMLFVWIVAHLTHQFLEHGKSPITPQVFLTFAQVLGSVRKDYESAYQFGRMALELNRRAPHPQVDAKVHFLFAWFCSHWKRHAKEDLEHALQAHLKGAEYGDLIFSSYGLIAYYHTLMTIGAPLAEVRAELEAYAGVLRRMNDQIAITYNLHIFPNVVRNLLGESADPLVFEQIENQAYSEEAIVDTLLTRGQLNPLLFYWLYKMQLAYLFRQPTRALEIAARIAPLQEAMMGELAQCEFNFYHSLTLTAVYLDAPEAERPGYLATLKASQEQLALWVRACPENFEHKYLLVEAELHRLRGHVLEAMVMYCAAIDSARKNQYTQNEAIAYELAGRLQLKVGDELAGRFQLKVGDERFGCGYLREAWRAYGRWGAVAKARALEQEFPTLLTPGVARRHSSTITTTETQSLGFLDVASLAKSLRAISSELRLDLQRLLKIIAEAVGARRAFLLRDGVEGLVVVAGFEVDHHDGRPYQPTSLKESQDVAEAVVRYVVRAGEALVQEDAASSVLFANNPFIQRHQTRSLLCAPLLNQGRLVALIYLDNNLVPGAFTAERRKLLDELLLPQAALSLENANLYARLEEHSHTLEQKVAARTTELREKNEALATAMSQLRSAQDQLVLQEKLASLATLTSGIAHEIKNPLTFINNFAQVSVELLGELQEVLQRRSAPEVEEKVNELMKDLRESLAITESHGRRASDIINSMLQHSQKNTGVRESVDLNMLLSKSVDLAHHGMRGDGFELKIREEYAPGLEPVEVVAADMRRVFVNVVNNAYYATKQKKQKLGEAYAPVLTVRTLDREDSVEISIHDNGTGIEPEVASKIFTPFYTTKPAGEGTGLGLSISYDIVVQGHQGEMRVKTEAGEFSEFIITLPKQAQPAASGGAGGVP